MKYYKGDKVYLIENRETATVTRVEDEQLLFVEVNGMEIPVFASDITKEIPEESAEESKTETVTALIEQTEELGLFICLEPQNQKETVSHFTIYIVNSLNTELGFDFQFLYAEQQVFSLNKNIPKQSVMLLYSIEYDDLNKNPSFTLQVKRKDIDKEYLDLTQKIKPNNLFNKERDLPFFNNKVYAYQVLQHWPEKKEQKTDFRVEKLKQIEETVLRRIRANEPKKKIASYESVAHEIDLHMENLMPDYKGGMSNGEILQLQIRSFRRALEKAIAGGVKEFYAIHGLGKGKLKEEIFRILPEYPQVKSFRNEYHPRYGFGATEIFLE